jgi:hypothetical protein
MMRGDEPFPPKRDAGGAMSVSGSDAPTVGADAARELTDLSRADVDRAGGKGANLGELTDAATPARARSARERRRRARLSRIAPSKRRSARRRWPPGQAP